MLRLLNVFVKYPRQEIGKHNFYDGIDITVVAHYRQLKKCKTKGIFLNYYVVRFQKIKIYYCQSMS